MSDRDVTRRALLLAGAGLAAGGCATAPLAPVTSAEFAPADDERRMWAQVEEAEKEIATSGILYKDPALDAYLVDVARRLQPPEVYKAIPFEVSVVDNPKMNAFALPTGHVYVHTGILARLDNEAQLATLLAHEMTHATHRHAIKGQRDLKSKAAASAVVGAAFGGVPIVGPMATMFTVLGTTAAITGYSRDLEREADVVGLGLMVKAGYDPAEAPKVFGALKREVEEEKIREPFLYSTHPRLQERIDTYEALLRGEYRDRRGGATGDAAFVDRTARVVLDTARSELRAGRFAAAERSAGKYARVRPRDGRGPYTLGEVYRQRAGEGDGDRAVDLYRKAIALDGGYADPHKGLGLVLFKRGEKRPAKSALERYLALAPAAPDRAYVQETIKLCAQ
jgi:predicted Zn-dependent protease